MSSRTGRKKHKSNSSKHVLSTYNILHKQLSKKMLPYQMNYNLDINKLNENYKEKSPERPLVKGRQRTSSRYGTNGGKKNKRLCKSRRRTMKKRKN